MSLLFWTYCHITPKEQDLSWELGGGGGAKKQKQVIERHKTEPPSFTACSQWDEMKEEHISSFWMTSLLLLTKCIGC